MLAGAERHDPGAVPLPLALHDYAIINGDLALHAEAEKALLRGIRILEIAPTRDDPVIQIFRLRLAEVYLDGASNILTKPEFSSAERMRELFRTFEEKSRLIKILNECVSGEPAAGNVKVVIGRENVASSMKRCAVITTSYQVGGDVSGTLGVVGPMRIEYSRMMAVVNYLGRFIERALSSEAPLH